MPRTALDRVVVTGVATLTSAGSETEQVRAAFAAGRTSTQVEHGTPVGRITLDPGTLLSARDRRRMDKLGMFSVIVSRFALQDAGIEITDANRERVAVLFGTGIGPMESMENFFRPLLEEGPQAANPAVFPNTVYNAAPGQVAMLVGAVGPTSTLTAGHAAGSSAICYSYDVLSHGRADAVICLAADTLTDTVIASYRDLEFFLPEGGPALSEAAIGLVLEGYGAAQQRGARMYGEVLGYGITQDALGIGQCDPDGQGLERAMRIALDTAGLAPEAIVGVWGTQFGWPAGDAAENAAIQRLLGGSVPVFTPKRLFGEPIGAGGALNASLALLNWRSGDGARGPVLVNSCSLGGTNVSLVLAPLEESAGGPQ